MNKYRNKKVMAEGIEFDSKLEAKRYLELRQAEAFGLISNLELQPVFELQPSFRKNGKVIRKITYKADFKYTKNSEQIVEDVKSIATASDKTYKLKKKMFLYKYQDLIFKEVY